MYNEVINIPLSTYNVTGLLSDLANKRGAAGEHVPVAGGRCAACNKVLEGSEAVVRGYGSGYELGLCRRCASHVNTQQAIEAAEVAGYTVHAKAVVVSEKGTHVAYNEGSSDE